MKEAKTYTQEQMDIALLKSGQNEGTKALERNESLINERLDKIQAQLDSHFTWSRGLFLGLYALWIMALFVVVGHDVGWIV